MSAYERTWCLILGVQQMRGCPQGYLPDRLLRRELDAPDFYDDLQTFLSKMCLESETG